MFITWPLSMLSSLVKSQFTVLFLLAQTFHWCTRGISTKAKLRFNASSQTNALHNASHLFQTPFHTHPPLSPASPRSPRPQRPHGRTLSGRYPTKQQKDSRLPIRVHPAPRWSKSQCIRPRHHLRKPWRAYRVSHRWSLEGLEG